MTRKDDLFAGPPQRQDEPPATPADVSELDEAIVRSLAERYRGIVDTRGLWLWAGGKQETLVYDDDAHARWQKLWDAAAADASTTRIALVREMLLDLPGDDLLLGYLEGQVRGAAPTASVLGEIVRDLIEAAGAEIGAGLLRAVLEALPAHVDDDQTFASLAPALQRYFDADARAHMETLLDSLLYPEDEHDEGDDAVPATDEDTAGSTQADAEPVGAAIDDAAGDATDTAQETCTANDLEAAVSISIDAFAARFERSPLATDEERRERVLSLTEDLRSAVHASRSGDSGKPQLKMADALGKLEMEAGTEAPDLHFLIAAIGHQVHCLVFVATRHPLPEPAEAARVFARSLWATLPADGAADTSAPS